MTTTATAWKNRIVGYADVPPDQLLANPARFMINADDFAIIRTGKKSPGGACDTPGLVVDLGGQTTWIDYHLAKCAPSAWSTSPPIFSLEIGGGKTAEPQPARRVTTPKTVHFGGLAESALTVGSESRLPLWRRSVSALIASRIRYARNVARDCPLMHSAFTMDLSASRAENSSMPNGISAIGKHSERVTQHGARSTRNPDLSIGSGKRPTRSNARRELRPSCMRTTADSFVRAAAKPSLYSSPLTTSITTATNIVEKLRMQIQFCGSIRTGCQKVSRYFATTAMRGVLGTAVPVHTNAIGLKPRNLTGHTARRPPRAQAAD